MTLEHEIEELIRGIGISCRDERCNCVRADERWECMTYHTPKEIAVKIIKIINGQ